MVDTLGTEVPNAVQGLSTVWLREEFCRLAQAAGANRRELCRRVGKSREAAYKLRRRPGAESFAAAWDAALGAPVRKLTVDDLEYRAYRGLIRPIMYGGRYVGVRRKPDNSALLRLHARLDRLLASVDERSVWATEQTGPIV